MWFLFQALIFCAVVGSNIRGQLFGSLRVGSNIPAMDA
jgi:hypothetical protein